MKSRAVSAVLALAFVTVTLFVVAPALYGQAKPIELSYSSFFPATYGLGQAATAWQKRWRNVRMEK